MMDTLAPSMMASARENMAAARIDQGRQAVNATTANQAQVREAAENFESMFLSQMFNHMFSGLKTDKMFGGGPGEDAWKSLLVDEYAKATARSGGVGIADHVMQAMLQAQEAAR